MLESFNIALNTSAFTEGVALWLSTTSGTFTATKPLSPNHLVHLGWVVRSHATEGAVLVHINNGWELEELHDVLITNVSDNEIIQYNATTNVWENQTLDEAGIVVDGDVGVTVQPYNAATVGITSTDTTNWNSAYTTTQGLGTASTNNTEDFDPAGTAVALSIALG